MQQETVIVLDFGGQYNQLIARRVRECNVYCEIYSYRTDLAKIKAKNPKGIIFTGGPNSAYLPDSPTIDPEIYNWGVPILGICYGSQLMMHLLGGRVCRAPEREYGFVAVAAGEGLKAVFGDLGVDAVVSGGQTMNPSTEDILAAIQSVPAKTVLVLPNNKNIIMASEQAQKLADRKVIVLPTRTVPQGMTAMLNFDPDLKPEENAVAMMQAADHVSTGLITYAARDSEFDGKPIKKGEIMALENGKIVATGTDLVKMTYRLARAMKKKDSQFITVISGCDVSDEDAEKTTDLVRAKCGSSVEVSHISGGQPVYYYMISVE